MSAAPALADENHIDRILYHYPDRHVAARSSDRNEKSGRRQLFLRIFYRYERYLCDRTDPVRYLYILVAVWSGSDPRTDPDRRDRLYDARDLYYGTCKSKDRTDFPFPDAELCFRTADRRDRQDDTFHPARNVFHRIIRCHTSGNLFLPEIRTRKRDLVFDIPQYFRILQRGI